MLIVVMQRLPYIGLASLALASACGFTINAGNGNGDAMGSGSDGSGSDVPAGCTWGYTPEFATPCPTTDGPVIDLDAGRSVLDTDTGVLMTGSNAIPIESEITADVRIVWTSGLHIAGPAQLQLIGTLPVVFVVTGAITIDGLLDGGGHVNSVLAAEAPPGANPAECSQGNTGAGVGQPCAGEGASGGGGGSFGEMGGQGGGGGDNRDCGNGNTDGMPGGTGGVALLSRPTTLRGGCPGAVGGLSTAGGAVAGRAGSGGGGVALIARDALTISGKVNVGGGGGSGSTARSGGGGGGSGGMIVLEGASVTLTTTGRVSANGGGGGGGCDNNSGANGEDSRDGSAAARGGAHEGGGGDGGDGGSRGHAPQNALISGRGGGGGGGGVGFVRVHSALANATAPDGAISPPPSN